MPTMAIWIVLGVLAGAALTLGVTRAGESPPVGKPLTDDGANCTALMLDRTSGRTVAHACEAQGVPSLEAHLRTQPRLRT